MIVAGFASLRLSPGKCVTRVRVSNTKSSAAPSVRASASMRIFIEDSAQLRYAMVTVVVPACAALNGLGVGACGNAFVQSRYWACGNVVV